MELFESISACIARNTEPVLLWVVIAGALVLIVLLFLIASTISLRKRYSFLLRHEQTQDLGHVFAEHKTMIDDLQSGQSSLRTAAAEMSQTLDICVQQVGLVRFDAFEDVGGHQSFALALLDARGDGVVLSSLYSRNDARTYAKAIRGGTAQNNLSAEEQEAIRLAATSRSREPDVES